MSMSNFRKDPNESQAGVSWEGYLNMPKVEVDSPSVEVKSPEGGFQDAKIKCQSSVLNHPKEKWMSAYLVLTLV